MRAMIVAAALTLAGCGQAAQEYPPDIEFNFMRACESQGSPRALCECTFEQIKENIPPADLAALERLPGPQREAHPLTAQISGYVLACNADLNREQSPAP